MYDSGTGYRCVCALIIVRLPGTGTGTVIGLSSEHSTIEMPSMILSGSIGLTLKPLRFTKGMMAAST
jgi:hypothetical protein